MRLGRRVFFSAILAGLGTRSAAIPTRFSNITLVSHSHHTPAATPAYSEIDNAADSLLLHTVGESSRTAPTSNPIATNLEDCNENRTNPAYHKANPSTIEESATQTSKTIHVSTLATGWNASEQQSTATPGQPLHLSTSASHTRVSLAAILLEPATDTFVQVPTPQTIPGGREQNVDPSSLSSATGKQSHHTTLGSLYQSAGSDGRRQMATDIDDTNDAIATATIQWNSVNVDEADSSDGVDNLVSAVGAVATLSGANAKDITQAPATTAEATDALDILLSALPSSVAESLESQYSATATGEPSTTRPTSRPTTRPTTRTRPVSTTSSSISSTLTSTSTTSTITSSSSTFTTSTRSTSNSISSTSSSPSATTTSAPPTDSGQLENNAVAGIATGVTAGAVLIILAVVFFLRRRQQGKPLFGARASQRSKTSGRAYPEVAWLYDPAPTPPNEPSSPSRGHQRDESASSLLPQVRQPQMAAMAVRPLGSNPYLRSPELGPAGQESPLLPPNMPAARDESPSHSPTRSGSQSPRWSARSSVNSSAGDRRPLHAIFEETHAQ